MNGKNNYTMHGQQETLRPIIRIAGVDDDLNLCMILDRPLDLHCEEMTAVCYDESYRPVAETMEMVVKGVQVELPLEPRGWWLDGNYHVLVYYNQELYAHYSFSYRNGETCENRPEPMVPQSQYYELDRIMNHSPHGKVFGLLSGYRSIKKHILRAHSNSCFIPKRPYLVSTEYKPDKMAMETLLGILYPHLECKMLDCQKVMERICRGEPTDSVRKLFEQPHMVVVHHLPYLATVESTRLLEYIYRQASLSVSVVVLYGTADETKAILTREPRFERIIPTANQWVTEPYTLSEHLRVAESVFRIRGLEVSLPARRKLTEIFDRHEDQIREWSSADYVNWIDKHVLSRQKKRVLGYEYCTLEDFGTVLLEDVEMMW